MAHLITITASNGREIEFYDEVKAKGGMKDVYFSPDKNYVVAFYRSGADAGLKDRLEAITNLYRDRIFNQAGGEYWQSIFCWPEAVVEYKGRIGIVVPFYGDDFFFKFGSKNNDMLELAGKEKESKWFTSPSNRSRFLDARETGTWMHQIKVCLTVARAVRRLHSAGLAHSDLSYKNILSDPSTGKACLIDLDGLVVPGKYPPEVVGTPDFIAPECVMTAHLDRKDPQRKLPSISTDEHALAIFIYMYLLLRHPLRGDKVHNVDDPQRDDETAMGAGALFIESANDHSNTLKIENVKAAELPWKNLSALPYTITGPYLSVLYEQAFVDGLHAPAKRPTADEWERALIKTVDLLYPCTNEKCDQKWFVFDNSTKPACPFCKTPIKGKLPLLNLYSCIHTQGNYEAEQHRLMVYKNQSLFKWHTNRHLVPNEKLSAAQKRRVGYFIFHGDEWLFVNEDLPDLYDVINKIQIPVGGNVKLIDGLQLLTSREHDGRLFIVQMIDAV
jgi:serine/threonine protein kinase